MKINFSVDYTLHCAQYVRSCV